MNASKERGPQLRPTLFPGIAMHLERLAVTLEGMEEPYRSAGRTLADWIATHYRAKQILPLVVVCTGNSRRSMLGAMMGNVSAAYHGLSEVRYFSGGTAPSAFNTRTITALQAIGFEIEPIGEEAPRGEPELPNPKYRVRWGTVGAECSLLPEAVEFSKVFSDPDNPQSGFAALMVCDEADAGCPFVPGAAFRLSMPFPDPKAFDGTAREQERYAATRDALGRLMMAVLGEARLRLDSR